MKKAILVSFGMTFFLILELLTQSAHAVTITVNTTDDELNSDGDCSLREAIQAANSDSAVDGCVGGTGEDAIALPAATYTLTLGSSLEVQGDLVLSGEGADKTVIQAATQTGMSNDRVFLITSGTVVISRVTIRYGTAESSGGGIQTISLLTDLPPGTSPPSKLDLGPFEVHSMG